MKKLFLWLLFLSSSFVMYGMDSSGDEYDSYDSFNSYDSQDYDALFDFEDEDELSKDWNYLSPVNWDNDLVVQEEKKVKGGEQEKFNRVLNFSVSQEVEDDLLTVFLKMENVTAPIPVRLDVDLASKFPFCMDKKSYKRLISESPESENHVEQIIKKINDQISPAKIKVSLENKFIESIVHDNSFSIKDRKILLKLKILAGRPLVGDLDEDFIVYGDNKKVKFTNLLSEIKGHIVPVHKIRGKCGPEELGKYNTELESMDNILASKVSQWSEMLLKFSATYDDVQEWIMNECSNGSQKNVLTLSNKGSDDFNSVVRPMAEEFGMKINYRKYL